ncbi:MAG: hypothetical protein CVT90_02620 [Candidatus Altiarchaeales archaeon HGW-Altiarchaeales-3]|nr:MAG: hypothetical protein CVT90_02620 [Candidatus Altiarchaeales archaeon HGW-Altiarchaeales-3]
MKEPDFSKFKNRYVITGKIVLESPLRIGSDRPKHSTSSASLLMRETPDGFVPFIPGSSLKGVLRSSCERIGNTFGAGEELKEIIRNIFGSYGEEKKMKGAQIRVRDCEPEYVYVCDVEERIHCATKFIDKCFDKQICNKSHGCSFNSNFYKVKLKDRKLEPDTLLVSDEEYIPPSVAFNFCIELDNASGEDVGMIFIGLDEFSYKRAFIGAGVSRGYGFVNIEDLKVEEIKLKDFDFESEDKTEEISNFNKSMKNILNKHKPKPTGEEFEIYNNTIVCNFDVLATTDFEMKGVDEKTVTVCGGAVIPGSTIKGFLRHSCYYTPILKGKPPKLLGCEEPKIKWNAEKVKEIFGSTNQRSKILVSDVFFEPGKEKETIEKDDKLICWIVFDNMENKDIKEIIDSLENENRITGKTSAKSTPNEEPNRNRVKFKLYNAHKFTTDDFYKDVTNNFKI